MSGRFTPAAATLISTSSAPTRGTGCSIKASSSAPSGCGATIANMEEGTLVTAACLLTWAVGGSTIPGDGSGRPLPEQAQRPAGRARQAGPRPDVDRGAGGADRGAQGRDRARRSP